MNENSETGYNISTKIPETLEGERILGAPPGQLLIKYPPGNTGCSNKNATFLTKLETIAFCSDTKMFLVSEEV